MQTPKPTLRCGAIFTLKGFRHRRDLDHFRDAGAPDIGLQDIGRFLHQPGTKLITRALGLAVGDGHGDRGRQLRMRLDILRIDRRLKKADAQVCQGMTQLHRFIQRVNPVRIKQQRRLRPKASRKALTLFASARTP